MKRKKKASTTSSMSSPISTQSIEINIDRLRSQRNRSSTRKNYLSIWKHFNKFIVQLDRKPGNWEARLTLFVGHLVSMQRNSQTIKSYISAIRSVLAENDIELNENKFLLNSLKRACRIINDRCMI